MSNRVAQSRLDRFTVSNDAFSNIFQMVYTALMVNVALIIANLPLAFMFVVVKDPLAAWPFFLILSATVPPSVTGAFGAFRAMKDDSDVGPISAFLHSYRRNAVRALVTGAASRALIAIVLIDFAWATQNELAPLMGPLLIVIAALAVAVETTALAGFTLNENVNAWTLVKAAIYVAMRRWYFSLVAVALVLLIAVAALVQPILGMVLAPSMLLFLIWSNAQFSYDRLVAATTERAAITATRT